MSSIPVTTTTDKLRHREYNINISYTVNERGEQIVTTTFGLAPLSVIRAMLREAAQHTDQLKHTVQG